MAAGEEEAFVEFFDAYFDAVYRFALARLERDDGGAQDVAQATLANAALKIHGYRGEAALFTWLCTICRREISGYRRRNRWLRGSTELREDLPEIRAALESLAAAPPSGSPEESRRSETVRLVHVALDALPRRYGDALEWKYVHGLSVQEIAERLSLGFKAAESLLSRARQAFRDGFSALRQP